MSRITTPRSLVVAFVIASTATAASLTSSAFAADPNVPPSQGGQAPPVERIPVLEVPGPDYESLWNEDLVLDSKDNPYRFAIPNSVSVTPESSGSWSITADGNVLWQLRIRADGAAHINLGFGTFTLPASAQMWMSSGDGSHIRGPWDATTNASHGEFWSPFVWGDELILEITVDAAERPLVEKSVELSFVNVGYRSFEPPWMGGQRGSSESCNIDVVCPQGDDWRNEIPSVGVYTVQGSFACTGSMINNTSEDGRNLFLTARHCGVTNSTDQSVVIYWNHENSTCRTGNSSGGNGNGHYSHNSSGCTVLVRISATDCCLVELTNAPNESWGVTYSGWSRTTSPGEGASIHHPECAEKRISFVETIDSIDEWGYKFWEINWDEGRTAPGSSGSPLYDEHNRIIGQLYGGSSWCTNDANDVYCRSISYSWSTLRPYLDPTNSNVMTLDTYNPDSAPLEGACCLTNGQCSITTADACDAADGTYDGDGSTCADVECASCDGDLNGDGLVDVVDILTAIDGYGTRYSVTDILLVLSHYGDEC